MANLALLLLPCAWRLCAPRLCEALGKPSRNRRHKLTCLDGQNAGLPKSTALIFQLVGRIGSVAGAVLDVPLPRSWSFVLVGIALPYDSRVVSGGMDRSYSKPVPSMLSRPYTTLGSAGCSSRAAHCHERSTSFPPEATRAYRLTIMQCSPALTHRCALRPQGGCLYLPLVGPSKQLALRHGGSGLRGVARHAPAAYWSSWANSLPVNAFRDPAVAHALVDTVVGGSPAPEVLQSLLLARASLIASGFAPPSWPQLLTVDSAHHTWFCVRSILRELDPAAAALLDIRRQAVRIRPDLSRSVTGCHWHLLTSGCCGCDASSLYVAPSRQDESRIEVIANGLPPCCGVH